MTYCKKCGKELPDAENRCPYCGEENTTISTPSGENVVSHKKRNLIIIITMAVLVICAAAFIVLYNLRNNPANILARAERYSTEQNFEKAINEYERLIEIKPNNAAAYIGLAETYIGLEQPDKAVETLKIGLNETNDESISTKLIELLSECADKNLNEDNYELAISNFEQILEIDRENINAYVGLADSYTNLANTDKAIETLKTGFENTSDE